MMVLNSSSCQISVSLHRAGRQVRSTAGDLRATSDVAAMCYQQQTGGCQSVPVYVALSQQSPTFLSEFETLFHLREVPLFPKIQSDIGGGRAATSSCDSLTDTCTDTQTHSMTANTLAGISLHRYKQNIYGKKSRIRCTAQHRKFDLWL